MTFYPHSFFCILLFSSEAILLRSAVVPTSPRPGNPSTNINLILLFFNQMPAAQIAQKAAFKEKYKVFHPIRHYRPPLLLFPFLSHSKDRWEIDSDIDNYVQRTWISDNNSDHSDKSAELFETVRSWVQLSCNVTHQRMH